MTKFGVRFVAAAVLMLAAMQAVAQSGSVRANIPFEFTVNHKSFPAGLYYIERVMPNNFSVLAIRSAEGHGSTTIIARSVAQAATQDPLLLFERTEGVTTLTSVRDGNSEYLLKANRKRTVMARTTVAGTTEGGR